MSDKNTLTFPLPKNEAGYIITDPRKVDESDDAFEECKIHGQWHRARRIDGTWYSQANRCPQCFKEAQEKSFLGRQVIPPRFQHCTFENYVIGKHPAQAKVVLACQQYADAFKQARDIGRCLIFSGGVGTGKNHLATAICAKIGKNGYRSIMATVLEMIGRIRDSWDKDTTEKTAEVVARFAEPDLLVLDEVGRQSGSQNEKNLIFQVIDARYREMKPTIVISNYTEGDIAAYLGEAAYDRLLENGGKRLDFTWGSFRREDR